MNTRQARGQTIAEKQGQIKRVNDTQYEVKSHNSDSLYDVVGT